MAVFRLLGSKKYVPLGLYDDYFSHGDLLTSNIFTMYRGLIADFSLVGSVIFMGVTGFVFHLCFYVMLKRKSPVFTVAAFVLMVGYFAHSYLASVFMYNSPYAVFGSLWIVLLLNKFMPRRGGSDTACQTHPVSHLSRALSKPDRRVQEA